MTEPLMTGAIVAVALVTALIGARGVRVARTPADFLVAARRVPSTLNASAISGEYLSAASFLGIAGLAMQQGLAALWYAVGYAAGYLVLLAAVAAPLRRYGAYTIPEFAEGRLGSHRLRQVATAMVLVICGFYLLPQLKGAGITLQAAVGSPYWLGVVVLGAVVTLAIASGGMKGITFVQAFHYWLKLVAIGVPALVLLVMVHHPWVGAIEGHAPEHFSHQTVVSFPSTETMELHQPVTLSVRGTVDGVPRVGTLSLGAGPHVVGAGSSLRFPAGTTAPGVSSYPVPSNSTWESPLLGGPSQPFQALVATYGVLIATFLGAMGLPHILVRFYTNRDGAAARRTTALVVLLLGCFYLFPAVFALLGRLEAPQLYVSGQTDSVVLVLPRIAVAGLGGSVLAAVVAAGAFAAFLSTSSGLLISMAGALSHDLMGRGVTAFRVSAVLAGAAATGLGLLVANVSINILVGWAFAIAASSFCPMLLLGIWWPGLTRVGAMAGLLLGGGLSSAAVVASLAGPHLAGWGAIALNEPAIWSVPLTFATMVLVSRATPGALPADVAGKLLALHLPERVSRPAAIAPSLRESAS